MTMPGHGISSPKRPANWWATGWAAAFTVALWNTFAVAGEGSSAVQPRVYKAAFVCVDGVYNSELMAPYDILHHSVFRDSSSYIEPFVVTPEGKPFVTFEGLTIAAHHSFTTAPRPDIVVIPSAAGSMDADLQNQAYISYLRRVVQDADFVITLCDGAFPLAATGALQGRVATTFPADRSRLAQMFPDVDVRYDVNFVVDGKFITSVGGALSYEPALYLLERMYSKEHARRTAQGLVLDWQLERIPHLLVERTSGDVDR